MLEWSEHGEGQDRVVASFGQGQARMLGYWGRMVGGWANKFESMVGCILDKEEDTVVHE